MPNHGMGTNRTRAHKKALRKRDGDFCQECREPFTVDLPPTIEHKVPRCRGGSNARENLELLCEPCNKARARRLWVVAA